jgi:hypothetical protein
MGLNIKNSKTESLIRELAELRGVSLVTAVTEAVEHEIKRERAAQAHKGPLSAADRYERLTGHARDYARRVANPVHSWEIDSLLYDDKGLPK